MSSADVPSAAATSRDGVPLTVQSLCNIEFCLPGNYELHKPVGKGAYGLVVSALHAPTEQAQGRHQEDQ